MDVKQEEIFEIKQEELIIKDEYISNPEPECTSVLTVSTTLTENCVQTRFPGKQYAPEDCSRQMEDKSTITEHEHTNNTLYKCNHCVCLKQRNSNDEYFCTNCYVNSRQTLNCFSCEHCHYKTSKKSHFKQHLLVHSREQLHYCEQCGFKTIHKKSLKQHLLVHAGEKPHHCQHCDFKTSYLGHLKRHQLVHGNEKAHHCEQCDFQTSHKQSLKQHLLTHTNKKSHCCKHCNFKTLYKASLKQHLLLHSSEKPHHRPHSDFKTAHKQNIKLHQMVRHSDIKTSSEDDKTFESVVFVIKEELSD